MFSCLVFFPVFTETLVLHLFFSSVPWSLINAADKCAEVSRLEQCFLYICSYIIFSVLEEMLSPGEAIV